MVGLCAIRNINFYRERLTSKWLVVLLLLAEEGERVGGSHCYTSLFCSNTWDGRNLLTHFFRAYSHILIASPSWAMYRNPPKIISFTHEMFPITIIMISVKASATFVHTKLILWCLIALHMKHGGLKETRGMLEKDWYVQLEMHFFHWCTFSRCRAI